MIAEFASKDMAELVGWSRAAGRALAQHLAELPDPNWYADGLPLVVAAALERSACNRATWRAADRIDAELLRPHGLCEYGGTGLTNFGVAVRRALMRVPS